MRGRIEEVKKGKKVIGYRVVVEMERTERYSEGKSAGRTKKKRLVRSLRGKSREEAYDALQQLKAEAAAGKVVTSRKQTLGQYLDEWLRLKINLSPKTRQGYELNIEKHIKPALGMYKLGELQAIQIQKLYQSMLDAGKSPRTVRYVHATLHAALEQALKWRILPFNPASAVEPPRLKKQERCALTTKKDVARFLKEAQKSQIFELLALALHTGMRRGELLALKWEDIDFDTGTIRIRRSIVRVKGVLHVKEVKEREEKAATVGGSVLAILLDLRKRNPHKLVFCQKDGRPLDPDTVSDWTTAIAKRAGFSGLTLHGLRHTNATILRAAGVDVKMIRERLGHHSDEMTWHYTHIDMAMQRQVAGLLDTIIPVGH